MNLILFGAPGAGKGTQSELLIKRLGMTQISTGDLFRAAIKGQTDLGKKAQEYMDKGQLVPDSIVIGMVEEVLQKGVKNFILDGFPRTVAQAEALDSLLNKMTLSIGKAIFLEVPMEILMDRLTGRRVCKNCGAVYHIVSKPTKTEGKCDNCGGEVVQRNDDKAEVIGTRLKAYQEFTSPLKEFYKKSGKYIQVDGNRDTELVYNEIEKIIS
ncbi:MULTISPECIES: adenylate kinase [unclassified Bdellovibrio]|uniref:adenylate kinase n=1 Tax=unclassified Bdellovibrio TaxID=2633795 RepID=UPI0011576573|nr:MULTISPECIES: adenylate kinase [unclassified Bdellovibrio]QDK44390.1 adenylate kinase [Bdellovibrio sp. ZAP7]QLY26215.1 adenylate kinase [Bdellovibrio sp. KM01]